MSATLVYSDHCLLMAPSTRSSAARNAEAQRKFRAKKRQEDQRIKDENRILKKQFKRLKSAVFDQGKLHEIEELLCRASSPDSETGEDKSEPRASAMAHAIVATRPASSGPSSSSWRNSQDMDVFGSDFDLLRHSNDQCENGQDDSSYATKFSEVDATDGISTPNKHGTSGSLMPFNGQGIVSSWDDLVLPSVEGLEPWMGSISSNENLEPEPVQSFQANIGSNCTSLIPTSAPEFPTSNQQFPISQSTTQDSSGLNTMPLVGFQSSTDFPMVYPSHGYTAAFPSSHLANPIESGPSTIDTILEIVREVRRTQESKERLMMIGVS